MQKGNILIFLLVGIVVLAAIGGAYYLGRSTTPKSSPTPGITSQVTPTPSASPAPTGTGETANWKTYTNKYWRFNLKYPDEWSQTELQNQVEDKYLTDKMGFSAFTVYFGNILDKDHLGKTITPYVSNRLQITVFSSGKENLSIEEASNKFLYCSGLYKEGVSTKNEISTEIESRKALVFKTTSCSLSGRTDIAYIIDGKKIYQIIYKIGNRESDIDQILSTFKFTQ